MTDSPKLLVQPGDYAAVWVLGDRSIPGEISVEPFRPPTVTLFGDVEPKNWSQGGGFPQDYEYARVVGRLRSNQDVVLTDAHISIWFPGRSLGSARQAGRI